MVWKWKCLDKMRCIVFFPGKRCVQNFAQGLLRGLACLSLVLGTNLSFLLGCGSAPAERPQQTTTAPRGAQAQSARTTASSDISSPQVEAIPVTVVRVWRQSISSYMQGTATLESDETVQVLAEAAGQAMRVAVEEGDWVERGQVLTQLDARQARVLLARARVQLAEAKMAYTSLVRLDQQEAELAMRNAELAAVEAREQHRRAQTMARRGLISQEDLDAKRMQKETAEVTLQQGRVRLEYKTIDDARFRYERAKTELQEAELGLQYTTVKAPITGVISQRQVVRGQFVQKHQPLFTIVDNRHLLARTFLPEKFSGRIEVGQPVQVEVEALPAQRFPAQVKLISPVIESESGTFKVTVALIQPPPVLKPGMFATVFITVATRAKALVVPKRALTLDSLQPTVYRVQRGRARRVALTVGVTDNTVVEVLSGLSAGDQVVVVGQDKLLEDTVVHVVADD